MQRVTKVTKGGSNMSFRATVVVGDGAGKVGVGCAKAREVQVAVTKAAADARKTMVTVPIAKGASFPHRVTVKGSGGAVVMLRPAGPGTGVIAGGACRTVLELAGYKNCFAKQLGSSNPLNNARAVVKGLAEMRTYKQVASERDMTVGASFPHRVTVKGSGGAVVMLRPAGPGTGVIAGGACRTVLELAGYKNCFAKQLGSSNPLNNARAVVKGLAEMRTYKQVASERDMTVEELFAA